MCGINAEQAARRHYDDGVTLADRKRYDNAGYHFGLAAECAVKQGLLAVGVQRGNPVISKAHFPGLRTDALLAIQDRRGGKLYDVIKNASFLQGWDIRMRYAPNGSVSEKSVRQWREEANVAILELL